MWLMSYITKNSITSPNAVKGSVDGIKSDGLSVASSSEHKQLGSCLPYGVISVPPVGERAVVLPLDDGEINLGVLAHNNSIAPGEVMLMSKGGASVVLKNDGRVLINGKEYEG